MVCSFPGPWHDLHVLLFGESSFRDWKHWKGKIPLKERTEKIWEEVKEGGKSLSIGLQLSQTITPYFKSMLLGFSPLTSSSISPWKLVRDANFQTPAQTYWTSHSKMGPSRKPDNSHASVKRSSPWLKAAHSLSVEFLCVEFLFSLLMTSWMVFISLRLPALSFLYWNNLELCFNSATIAMPWIWIPNVYKAFIIPILKMPKTEAQIDSSSGKHTLNSELFAVSDQNFWWCLLKLTVLTG